MNTNFKRKDWEKISKLYNLEFDDTMTAAEIAKKYGKECQVDMINVDDKESLAKEAVAAGADIIGVHTGLDAQAAGHTPFADLASIAALNTGAKISVAGGVKAATAQEVKDAGAAIIVAGAAIYGAADPAAAASEITAIAH